MQLTLRVPGTFRRGNDLEDTHCSFDLGVADVAALARASVRDATVEQVLDLQRFQLARSAWDVMTPEQQREAAGEILRTVALGAVREMTWDRTMEFFSRILPTEELRQRASPEACEKIVLAATDRLTAELKNSWGGADALQYALKAHVASIVAEHARREGLAALDDNAGKDAP